MFKICSILFLVISFGISLPGLYGAEKESAAKPDVKDDLKINEKIESLPERPSEKIIKEKYSFNSWINTGFTEFSKRTSYSQARELFRICFAENGIFKSVTKDGRTIEDLDSLIQKLEGMQGTDNSNNNAFKETFVPQLKDTRKEVYSFLTNNTVYKGLEKTSSPDEIIAHWFQYGCLYAHDPNKIGPLFTQEFRVKIYGNQHPKAEDGLWDSCSIYDFLEEFLEVYYELGIEHLENSANTNTIMTQAFNTTKVAFAPLITQKDKQTLTVKDKGEKGSLVWKFEEGAWRFNGLTASDTKEK